MVFVGFRSIQIWIFLCSFSPTCLVAKKISIRQFFFWATEWALKYHGPTGPVVPAGWVWAPQKNSFTNRAGFRLRVQVRGSGLGMIKPDPLPFLLKTARPMGRLSLLVSYVLIPLKACSIVYSKTHTHTSIHLSIQHSISS